jgi:hypothetical protein
VSVEIPASDGRGITNQTTMSDFVFLFRASASGQQAAMGTPERAEQSLRVWLDWIHSLETGGHLANRGLPLEQRGVVVRGSARVVSDGPFVEVKDMVAGFIVIQARDLAEAAELAKGCPMLEGDGSVEIRPVFASMFDGEA